MHILPARLARPRNGHRPAKSVDSALGDLDLAVAADFLGMSEDDVRHRIDTGGYTGYHLSTSTGEVIRVKLTSLDLVFNEVKARQEEALQQVSTLDTKASFVLGSASLFVAAVTGFQGALTDHAIRHSVCAVALRHPFCASFTIAGIARVPEVVAGIAYVAILYSALKAYGIRPYKAFEVGRLQQYAAHPETDTKRALIRALVTASDANKWHIDNKVMWTQRAVRFFILGGIALLMMILLSVMY